MAVENQIRLGQDSLQKFLIRWGCLAAALWIVLFILPGCADPELDHQQQVAERNARFWNACAAMGKQRIVNEWQNGQLVCYAWDKKPGKHQTPAVIASAEDL